MLKTYIQQINYDGTGYTKGTMVDLEEKFNIVCQEFPFKINPTPKDLPTRNWMDEDGLDVYIPEKLPIKEYDIDVTFLYVGEEEYIRSDLSAFIDFLYGRIPGNNNDTVKTARLAIYNEYVQLGRKDVVISEISNELFYVSGNDPDAVAKFNVKFMVYDPVTNVTPSYQVVNGVRKAVDLLFEDNDI